MLKELLFNSHENDSLVAVARSFVRLMKIKITPGEIEHALLTNPHYPSLAALTDFFNYYKVDTLALNTTVEHLPNMEFPLLAHVTDDGGKFIVLKDVTQGNVIYLQSERKRRAEPLENFSSRWTGTILMAAHDDESGDPDYVLKKRQENILHVKRYALIVMATILTMGGAILSVSYIISAALFLSLLGCAITIMIKLTESSKRFKASKFCNINRSTDCEAVLNSPASRLFGVIPVTSIGFIFFAGLYLSVLTGIVYGNVPMDQITFISLLALPYTIFSVWYQYNVVKKWCPLCLAAQGVIVLLAGLLIANYSSPDLFQIGARSVLLMLLSFAVPAIYMSFPGEPFKSSAEEIQQLKRKLCAWTRDEDLFQFMLPKGRYIDAVDFSNEIVLGNPAASNRLLLVLNPNCAPCVDALKTTLRMYHILKENVKLNIRFNFNERDSASVHIVNQLLSLNLKSPEEVIIALNDMITLPIEKWMMKYNELPTAAMEEQRRLHLEWCLLAGITATPAVFVNGHQLPDRYTIYDLPYLIPVREQVMEPA